MFGFSFGEIVVLLLVGIVVLGPRQLPTMLRTLGRSVTKLRRMAFDMRAQSGIDDILRDEGLDQDLRQLRSILRRPNVLDALAIDVDAEIARDRREVPKRAEGTVSAEDELAADDKEYPSAGVDAFGAAPEDLDPYREGVPEEPELAEVERTGGVEAEQTSTRGQGAPELTAVGVDSHQSEAPPGAGKGSDG